MLEVRCEVPPACSGSLPASCVPRELGRPLRVIGDAPPAVNVCRHELIAQ